MQYILVIFFLLLQLLLDLPPPSYLSNFMFFLLRNKNKTHKNVESILCWLTTPDDGVCPGVWLIYPV